MWIIYLVVSVCTIVTFSVIALIGNASWWNGSFWGDEWSENDYCEYVNVDGFLRQKSNTISNLPFVLVGEFLIFLYMNDTQKNKDKREFAKVNRVVITYTDPKVIDKNCDDTFCTIKQYPIWTLIYGIKLIYLGTASCLFHGSMKSLGQRLDVAAIYANVFYWLFLYVFEYLVSYKVDRLQFKMKIIIIVMVLFDIIIIPTKNIFTSIFFIIMPGSMLMIVILCIVWYYEFGRRECPKEKLRSSTLMGICAVLLTAIGYFVGAQLDAILCSPRSLFQFHSAFHVTTAIGMLMLIFMFRLQIRSASKVEEADDPEKETCTTLDV